MRLKPLPKIVGKMMVNKLELQRFRNYCARQLTKHTVKRNVVYFNTHNSLHHEMLKARICYELQKYGFHYVTEAPLKEGVADILILDLGMIIEITVSETEKRLKQKIKKYPDKFEVIPIRSFKEFEEAIE
jgi:hypothetical protein